jgi:hypothetical protein
VPNQPIQLRLDVENESVLSLYVDGVPLLPKVRGSVVVVAVVAVVVVVVAVVAVGGGGTDRLPLRLHHCPGFHVFFPVDESVSIVHAYFQSMVAFDRGSARKGGTGGGEEGQKEGQEEEQERPPTTSGPQRSVRVHR